MSKIKHSKIEDIPASHKCEHEGYEYYRRKFIPFGGAKNSLVTTITPMDITTTPTLTM